MRTLTVNEMIAIQIDINNKTMPDWDKKLNHDDINVAIMDEVAELLGSGRNWAWWKPSKQGRADTFNELIEIVDVVLFYTSRMALDNINSELVLGIPPVLLQNNPEAHTDDGDFDRRVLNRVILELYKPACSSAINALLFAFNITQETLAALYIAKTTLHEIRMSAGYKDGTYKKVQDGIEDNKRMEYIIDAFLHNRSFSLNDIKKSVLEEFFEKSDV